MMGHVGMLLWCLLAVGLLVSWVWRVLAALLWRPLALTRSFARQGVRGPPYRFFSGSLGEIRAMNAAARRVVLDVHSHDITHRVMPHYHRWSSQYGETFLFWFGPQPRISISDSEMAKQVLSKFSFYTKENVSPSMLALLGKGLLFVEGLDWVRHRRVVSPAFTMDKLKVGHYGVALILQGMTKKMAECTMSMLDGWRDQVVQDKEVEIDMQFKELTANVICHTALGSSYAEGKEVFLAQKDLQLLVFATAFDVSLPGHQSNLQKWRLERRIRGKLTSIIQRRLDSNSLSYGDDLLGLMMDACRMDADGSNGKLRLDMDEIIDECKTFFFAGHETTSHLLTWTMFLLGSNAEWQERLREEVLWECGMEVPDAEGLSKLKLTNMVLLEALRLYSPVTMMIRQTHQDMKLGDLTIPNDTVITIPLTMMHRSEKFWGADASYFNPLRFENGVSRAAKHPSALLAFSVGPRSCVGQSFAMLEAKLVMAMILQRFSFTLSSNYRHAPITILTLQPEYGLPVVIRALQM